MANIKLIRGTLVKENITDFSDGERLIVAVEGSIGPLILTIATNEGGEISGSEAVLQFEETSPGVFDIPPGEVSQILENSKVYFSVWEFDDTNLSFDDMDHVAQGTITRRKAIKPTILPGSGAGVNPDASKPTSTKSLSNVVYAQNDGLKYIETSGDFDNKGFTPTYELAPLRSWATINPDTGRITIDTDNSGVVDPAIAFVVTLTTSKGSVSSGFQLTIEEVVVNQPPSTDADTATVVSGSSVDIDVLANDSDPEGDPLTVVQPVSVDFGTVAIINGGVEGGPQIRYTADGGTGTATITYTVSDGTATSQGTATVSVGAEPATGVTLQQIEALYLDPTTRGYQGGANRIARLDGTGDPLPAGATQSGDTIVIDGDVDWSNSDGDGTPTSWHFQHVRMRINAGHTVNFGSTGFLFEEHPDGQGWINFIDMYIDTVNLVGARVTEMGWGTFRAAGPKSVMSAFIKQRTDEGVDPTLTAPIDHLHHCAFFGSAADPLKLTSVGLVEWNYIDPPINMPYKPEPWTSGTVTNSGELVASATGKYAFLSRVDGNTDQPPEDKIGAVQGGSATTADTWAGFKTFATGDLAYDDSDFVVYRSLQDANKGNDLTNTSFWEPEAGAVVSYHNRDPHADLVNPLAVCGDGVLEVRYNYLNRESAARLEGEGWGWGINNHFRTSVNTGSSIQHRQAWLHHNVLAGGDKLASVPIQLANEPDNPNWEPDLVEDNWITPNAGGVYIHELSLNPDNGNVFRRTTQYDFLGTIAVLRPVPQPPGASQISVYEEDGSLNPTNVGLLRISLDGGTSWQSLTDAGLTASWDDNNHLRLAGASLVGVANANILAAYSHHIPGEPNNSTVDPYSVLYSVHPGTAPTNPTVPGPAFSSTDVDYPVRIT